MTIVTYLLEHKATVIFVAGTIASAAVATMPAPGTAFSWYTWAYDFSHQFTNSRNTRLSAAVIPTPPASQGEIASGPKVQ